MCSSLPKTTCNTKIILSKFLHLEIVFLIPTLFITHQGTEEVERERVRYFGKKGLLLSNYIFALNITCNIALLIMLVIK